jgi:hypothetical protein
MNNYKYEMRGEKNDQEYGGSFETNRAFFQT